jgi:3-isopropylmalate/(R)-2-methylmalate dehydratase small subunit
MADLISVKIVTGRPLPLRGNDIDTDRIIPARFMKAVTFDGLGQLAFQDERFAADGSLKGHVMDEPRYMAKGDRVAVVNKNFGCGSSREHAPQALLRWGIKALIGESFADIFYGNCIANGMPIATADAATVEKLLVAIEEDPAHDLTLDVDARTAAYRGVVYAVAIPDGVRKQLLDGTWDATRVLLAAADSVRATAKNLPYVVGF